jgi:phosphoglycolate phosphatase-like HAD superfamily hydrolase
MKAILFDLDGTLTDPREGITRSIAHALERMGVEPPPLDELTFAIGPPLRDSLVRHFGLDMHFVAVHGCELDGTREDKRDLLAHLIPRHGVACEAAVMIGDRGAELRDAGAHALCERPQALVEAIGQLRAGAPT